MGTMWGKLVLGAGGTSLKNPPHPTPKLEEKALTASSPWPKAGSPAASPTSVLPVPAAPCVGVVGNAGYSLPTRASRTHARGSPAG